MNLNEVTISFIIVNYNSGEKTCKLIESIRKSGMICQIIVVDNASVDSSRGLLNEIRGKDLHCIYNEENLGYGCANNIGVAVAVAEVIVLVNPDVVFVEPLEEIESFFVDGLNKQEIGMIAPKIIYPNGNPQPNYANQYSTLQTYIPQLFSLGKIYSYFRKNKIIYKILTVAGKILAGRAGKEYVRRLSLVNQQQSCAWVSGACIAMKKDVFKRVNGFDDAFFLYSEDEDLCRRVKKLDLLILYSPELQIVHEVGGTHSKACGVGMLDAVDTIRIESCLVYLRKYTETGWLRVKYGYIFVVAVRMVFGLYVFVSPRKSLSLLNRLLKV
jgi:GT2 family glycosyltransferase